MDDCLELWCLIEGDDAKIPFKVKAKRTGHVGDLASQIFHMNRNAFVGFDAKDLFLYKVCNLFL